MSTFVVYGMPATKGSIVSYLGRDGLITRHDCKTLAAWTQAVGWAVRAAKLPLIEFRRPVRLTVTFAFVRPKADPKRPYPTVRPDVDKLTRALLDALTGIAYKDDAQVVSLRVEKVYGPQSQTTVQIEQLG